MSSKITNSIIDFEHCMCEVLSTYRLVPALISLAKPDVADDVKLKAEEDLVDFFMLSCNKEDVSQEDISMLLYEFAEENYEWLLYIIADFGRYFSEIMNSKYANTEPEKVAMHFYHQRMTQQAEFLLWNTKVFKCYSTKPVILDLGCGTSPYITQFVDANDLKGYVGVDTKVQNMLGRCENTPIRTIRGAARQMIRSMGKGLVSEQAQTDLRQCNTLFMAEFLHCLADPLKFMKEILGYMAINKFDIREIKILDVDRYAPLNYGLNHHLKTRCGGGAINKKDIKQFAEDFGFSFKAEKASTQHVMGTLIKK